MRLDHLLSKELVGWARGWNVGVGALLGPEGLRVRAGGRWCGLLPGAGGWVWSFWRVAVVGIPFPPWLVLVVGVGGVGVGVGWCGWCRSCVENCIVDVSIFGFLWCLLCVVKFVRAHGGCLGTRSR